MSSRPLHELIRTDIERKILSGALAPGDRIQVEHELMAVYGCSRMTVNKALSALVAAGLITRRRGAGSAVAHPRVNSMILDVPDLPTEVSARGHAYAFQLLSHRIRAARRGVDGEHALAATGKLVELRGLHLADTLPLAVEHRLIGLASVPAAATADFSQEPPGTWLLRLVPWTEAKTRIAAIAADRETASLLGVEHATPCLLVERQTWRGEAPITSVTQIFLGSRYDLAARFTQTEAGARRGG